MAQRPCGEEIVTIEVLARKGQNNCEIARAQGTTEGAVRYPLKRLAEGRRDRRKDRPFKAQAMAAVVEHWVRTHRASGGRRPINVQELYEYLVVEHGYEGHYTGVHSLWCGIRGVGVLVGRRSFRT